MHPGADNQKWTAKTDPGTGASVLQARHSGAYRGSHSPDCNPDGRGVVARTESSTCTQWRVDIERYRFATNRVYTRGGSLPDYDNAVYSCLAGYELRASKKHEGRVDAYTWTFTNISDKDVNLPDPPTRRVSSASARPRATTGKMKYVKVGWGKGRAGQLFLYCDPT